MMVEQGGGWFSLTNIARVAVFAAFAFGVNAPFWAIPNVETFSLALFLAGLFLGIYNGIAAAFIAGIIFIFFNPNGPQPVVLVGIVQVAGFMLFGLCGGAIRNFALRQTNTTRLAFVLALTGLLLTFWYDLSTNLAFAVLFGPFFRSELLELAGREGGRVIVQRHLDALIPVELDPARGRDVDHPEDLH